MNKLIERMSNIFLFKDIPLSDIKKYIDIEGYYEKEYEKDQIIMDSNTEKFIGLIISGKSKVVSINEDVTIKTMQKNDLFGAATIFNDNDFTTKVVSISKCKVLCLTKSFVLSCINSDNKIALNYIHFLSNRICFLNSKISSYTAKSAENKLLTYLNQLPSDDGVITIKDDYSTIAKMLGIGRASLYRAFDKLEADCILIRKGKNIILKGAQI